MRREIFFIGFLVLVLGLFMRFLFAQENSEMKNLSLQWEKVPQADYYEIMFFHSPDQKGFIYRSEVELFNKSIPSRFNSLKIRSVKEKSGKKIYSKWSDSVSIPLSENKKNSEKIEEIEKENSEEENKQKTEKPRKKYSRYLYPKTRLFILPSFSYRNGYWINKKTIIRLVSESKISKENKVYYSLRKKNQKKKFILLEGNKLPVSSFLNKEGEFYLSFYSIDEFDNEGKETNVILMIDTTAPRIITSRNQNEIQVEIKDHFDVTGEIRTSDRLIKKIYNKGTWKIPLNEISEYLKIEVKDSIGNHSIVQISL